MRASGSVRKKEALQLGIKEYDSVYIQIYRPPIDSKDFPMNTRYVCVLSLSYVISAMSHSRENCNASFAQTAIEPVNAVQTHSVSSLLSALAKNDTDSVEELLEAEWQPSAEVFRDLFVAIDATSDNESRFAIERAIKRSIGATGEESKLASTCVESLRADPNANVGRIAAYFADFMIPYDFTDEQNCERMRFTNSEQDSIRWLAIRHLSFCRRYYLIETSPEILFRIVPRTPRMVVPCLIDQLDSDASEAVQLVSLEGLWWYYSMRQISTPEFRKVLSRVKDGRSQKLIDLASKYETKISLSAVSATQSGE